MLKTNFIICLLTFFSVSVPASIVLAQHAGNSRYIAPPKITPGQIPQRTSSTITGTDKNTDNIQDDNRIPHLNPSNNQATPDPIQAKTTHFNNSELLIDCNILLNAQADYQVAIFSIREEHPSLVQCQDSLQKKIDDFIRRLIAIGVPAANIYIDVITQVPIYGYDLKIRQGSTTTEEIPIGYELKKNVHVRYDDERMANPIMDAAARSNIYDLAKVDYVVGNLEQINAQLRSKAIDLLKKRLDSYKELGINVVGLIGLQNEIIQQYFPSDRYASYSAFNNSALNALKGMNGVSPQLIEGIKHSNIQKHTTYYYDKIPFTRFDAILNPEVISPKIQFLYQIEIKYRVKPN